MIIRSLELDDYRNYEKVSIKFDKGINILYGDNAQGKTNILEAICLCSTTKSHRGNKDKEIIRFGCKESHIRALFNKNEEGYDGKKADVYSYGMTIYSILYDTIPFEDIDKGLQQLKEGKIRGRLVAIIND